MGVYIPVRPTVRTDKKFELMLTRRTKAYSSSSSVVTHRSTNRARRRVTSFQSKRVTNYATPPTPVPWRHLVNDIDLRSRNLWSLWRPPAPDSMNLGNRDLDCWNLRLMQKISSMLINPKSLSPVLLIISSMSVPICNRVHTTRDNCGKITTF